MQTIFRTYQNSTFQSTLTSQKSVLNPHSGYIYGYQGSEMDNEVKTGDGNSYTTFFRQLDPRLGRWLSIDPKTSGTPWESPFTSMSNNPIKYNDPLGDVVDKKKDEGVKGSDFRKMKRNIRRLRRNSETFSAMYDDLNSRKETYVFLTTNDNGGNSSDPYIIKIGAKYTQNTPLNSNERKKFAQMGMIAHETGHRIRGLYQLDPAEPILETRKGISEDFSRMNKYYSDYVDFHSKTERGAMNIENIVRGELQKVHRFKDIEIHRYYSPSFTLDMQYIPKKGLQYKAVMGNGYDTFDNGKYSKDYYQKTFNIYEELGIIPNYSELFKLIQSGKMHY